MCAMNRLSFIVGVATVITAIFVGVAITFRGGPVPVAVAALRPIAQQQGSRFQPAAPPHKASAARSTDHPFQMAAASSPPPPLPVSSFQVSVPDSTLAAIGKTGREQWIASARKVESQARTELASLTRQFDLTPNQQQKIFPLLAQAAAGYRPGMIADGLANSVVSLPSEADAVEDAIYNELDPEQQDAIVEVAIDNQLWWKEIVGQLQDDLDAAIGVVADDGANPISEAADVTSDVTEKVEDAAPAAREDTNIFDLLK